MPAPVLNKTIVKKRRARFLRQHVERYKRLSIKHNSWRKPKGIDSRMRRRFKGQRPLANIGYGSDKKTKFLGPNHLYTFLVHNVADLEVLLMHNKKYAAEIGHAVSFQKRKEIITRAQQLDILVTNKDARIRHQE
uniref:Ribosomal protein L32e n=1 Tax=Arcella intermedia TaxID=1963864 RepID=A0A6B2LQR7_9EUKA|eukprot:TRINITY_DN5018_c0_g1_i1.p1 TRINITY_DN5018_c0_g1~~TRINITY_DN5018_c0_g1_i1.p1  ORF type:complete len:156 (-),score=12.58 TRINITY_DN5018_c0_g1_i1:112-516(-)